MMTRVGKGEYEPGPSFGLALRGGGRHWGEREREREQCPRCFRLLVIASWPLRHRFNGRVGGASPRRHAAF